MIIRQSSRFAGFTLLELLIVVALIMILSAIGVGGYITAVAKSQDTQRKNDLNQYAKALESFFVDVGRYPTSAAGKPVCYDISSGTGIDAAWNCDKLMVKTDTNKFTTYITVPKDPEDPTQKYYYVSDGASFALYTTIQNKDDKDLIKTDDVIITYDEKDGVDCGVLECNYKINETGLIKTVE